MTRWTVEHRTGMPTIVLPDGMDTSGMIEVATIGQRFARFLCHDGTEVDGSGYARRPGTCRRGVDGAQHQHQPGHRPLHRRPEAGQGREQGDQPRRQGLGRRPGQQHRHHRQHGHQAGTMLRSQFQPLPGHPHAEGRPPHGPRRAQGEHRHQGQQQPAGAPEQTPQVRAGAGRQGQGHQG